MTFLKKTQFSGRDRFSQIDCRFDFPVERTVRQTDRQDNYCLASLGGINCLTTVQLFQQPYSLNSDCTSLKHVENIITHIFNDTLYDINSQRQESYRTASHTVF